MHLLQSGVPFNVIALWLGHESTNTTHRFGGWPAFAYAWLTGTVVDPTEQKTGPRKLDEMLAKHGGDGMSAYMEMIGVGRSRC